MNNIQAPLALRPYQREAIEAIRVAYQQRAIRRPLIVLPTGAGKTVVFSHLARRRASSGRTLVIAHREELLTQAADKITTVAPDLTVGIVKAERDEHHHAHVVVASIQTIARPKRLAPLIGTIATIVVDEAHHAAARTYLDTLTALGAFNPDGPLTVGVTATAGRGDGVGLGAVWQDIVYQRGIIQMIAEGYLVDVRGLEIATDLDYCTVTTSHGDFTDASLGAAMEAADVMPVAAAAYAQHAADRPGIAFTPTIATAEQLARELGARGISAEAVSGQTDREQRQAILRRLHTGATQVVCNCAVLTEGFDETAVSCVLVARPTKSKPLFVQMAGRALRLHPGKDDALVLNLFAPPEQGLATIADLAGLPPEQAPKPKPGEGLAEAVIREDAEQRAFGRRYVSNLTVREINLFARSSLRWIPTDGGFVLPCNGSSLLLLPEADADKYRVVQTRPKQQPKVISAGLTLDWAQGVGEEYARAYGGVIARADAKWRAREPTDAQRTQLARLRLPVPATRGEASDAISAANARRDMARLVSAA